MQFPVKLRFKLAAIASQIYVTDASGANIFYVKQKLFKLKENIEIFTDSTKTQKIYTVKADRVIDFSPVFTLLNAQDQEIGSVKRLGRKSIWRATYQLQIGPGIQLTVSEINPWVKVADAFLSEIPFFGLISGHILHPKYAITDTTANQQISILSKQPAFFEGVYSLDNLNASFDENTQQTFTALMIVVVLRERLRG